MRPVLLTDRRRTLILLEALAGAALLLDPGLLLRCCGERTSAPRVDRVARVLGARQLVQAALLARSGATPDGLRLAAGVDGAHAASMLALAWGRPQDRAPALFSAGAAVVFCCWELAAARSATLALA